MYKNKICNRIKNGHHMSHTHTQLAALHVVYNTHLFEKEIKRTKKTKERH